MCEVDSCDRQGSGTPRMCTEHFYLDYVVFSLAALFDFPILGPGIEEFDDAE